MKHLPNITSIYVKTDQNCSHCPIVVLLYCMIAMLSGCATWDTEAVAAYQEQMRMQNYLDQQLRNQEYSRYSQAMLNQYSANIAAQQQQLQSQLQTTGNWHPRQIQQNCAAVNRPLVQYSAPRPVYQPPHWGRGPGYTPPYW